MKNYSFVYALGIVILFLSLLVLQPMLAGYTAFSAAKRSGFQPVSSNKSDGKLDLAVANDGSNSVGQGAPSNSAAQVSTRWLAAINL
ncbi:MAG: hypothetical protein ACREBD_01300 [Blastocatellia bacterium]